MLEEGRPSLAAPLSWCAGCSGALQQSGPQRFFGLHASAQRAETADPARHQCPGADYVNFGRFCNEDVLYMMGDKAQYLSGLLGSFSH